MSGLFLAGILMITVYVVGFLGNVLCIVAILFTKLIQNPFNKYLVVLLVSDTLYTLWHFESFSTKVENRHFLACALLSVISTSTMCAGSNMIVVLTMERFFAIVFPLWHMQYGHINHWIIILLALLPMQLYSIYFHLMHPYFDPESFTLFANGTCYHEGIFSLKLNTIPFHVFIFVIPLSAVIFVNVAIIIKLRQRRNPKSSLNKSSSGETLWLLPVLYTALSTPMFIIIYIKQFLYPTSASFDPTSSLDIILGVFVLLYRLDFIYHWIFYAFSSKSFRKTFISFWFRMCRKTREAPKIDSSNTRNSSLPETCT